MQKALLLIFTLFLYIFSPVWANEKTLTEYSTFSKDKVPTICEIRNCKTKPQSISNLTGNFPNEIKVFFSDIDGTLIPTDKSAPKGHIQQSVIEGAKELHDADIPLYLITGRSSKEAIIIAKKIGINTKYVIGQQGAEIATMNGDLIYESGISSEVAKKILCDISAFNKKNGNTIVPFIYVKGVLYTFQDSDLPYVIDKPVKLNSISDLGKNFSVIKVGLYSSDYDNLKAIRNHLARKYKKYNVVISADCYCDLSSKAANKGEGIKILTEILGVELKNVAAIGDNENDISMLKLIKSKGGLAIAVENANKKTKKNANYVSTNVANCGFLNAARSVLANNNLLKTKNLILK